MDFTEPLAADSAEMAGSVAARARISAALIRQIGEWHLSQAAAAKRLGISRPRLNDLLRKKVEKFSLDALVNIAAYAGLSVEIQAYPSANSGRQGTSFPPQGFDLDSLKLLKATPNEEDMDQVRRNVVFLMNAIVVRWTRLASETYSMRFELGVMDMRVVAVLVSESGLSGARIAELGSLDKAAVSRALVVLQRAGLVANLAKGRTARMALTPSGKALFHRASALARERHQHLLSTLSPTDQRSLRDLLFSVYRPLAVKTPRLS